MRRLVPILALSTLLLAGSAAAAPNPAGQAALDRTVRYLQETQQPDGGFGAPGEPSQITTAWVALALAAAGINPQDQARPGGVDAFTHLVANYRRGIEETECAPIACTTTLERELMVVNASGADPHDFGGVDLAGELIARAEPGGWFPHEPGGGPGVNDTIFAIFALAPIGEPAAQAPIQRAAEWIESAQHASGGWAWSAASTEDEVDMTGAAIQALIAAGRGRNAAVEKGLDYLRGARGADGGFPARPGGAESNVASTAWAVQAIWAAGESPEDWRAGPDGEEPLGFMESLQEPDGHIRWKRSQDLNGVWMTAYTTPAFAGRPWPIPAAPRARRSAAAPQSGEGEGTQSGEGVIAGGGGRGARLFSRPKPQSRGKTAGGARVLHSEDPADRSETRRGANAEQPAWTQASEAEAFPDDPRPGSGRSSSGKGLPVAGRPAGGSAAGGSIVTGALIGSTEAGELGPGAPGLHSAGAEDEQEVAAIGIGAAAVLIALGGARWERRRQEAVL